MIKITWKGDVTGLDLKPTWIVEEARIHTVKSMLQLDGETRKDTLVLYVKVNEHQLRKLVDDYGKDNIPLSILGVQVINLEPNAILWAWKPPKGYEHIIKKADYTAFTIEAFEE